MNNLKNFTTAAARPLPVILLLDVSGSMSQNGKIQALNKAVEEMIVAFAKEDSPRVEIHVAIITFGGEKATMHQELQPANLIVWKDMVANGQTPMGSAFQTVTELIEDRTKISGRSYAPTVVLVSDGHPTKEPTISWQDALAQLLRSERASKAARLAMAIGEDADLDMLQVFLSDPDSRVFQAYEATEIRKFFLEVTMSVTSRSRSNNPNQIATTEDEPEY